MESLPLLVLIALALVLFIVMPQRQRKSLAAKQAALREQLVPGTRVMTTSGLYAHVVRVTDTTAELEIAPGVVTSWLLAAVREVAPEPAADASAGSAGSSGATAGGPTGGIVEGNGDPTDPTR